MFKAKLTALKRIDATPSMIKMARENSLEEPLVYKERYGSAHTKLNTRYDLFIRCQSVNGIFMVALFFPEYLKEGITTPLYEIYCDVEKDDFITRIQIPGQAEKWVTAKMYNLGKVFKDTWICHNWSYYKEDIDSRIYQAGSGKILIKKILKTKEVGYRGIVEWQDAARVRKIEAKEARQQQPWDADMALIPEKLEGFAKWTLKEGSDEHFIFYDYKKGGATSGYCSYCSKEVPVKKPKHNENATCSCCGKKIKYKVKTKISTLSKQTYSTELVQKIPGGIVARKFETRVWYRGTTFDKPHSYMRETTRRMAFDTGEIKMYEFELWKNKKMRWVPNRNDYYIRGYGGGAKLYKRNLSSLKKTVLKNSAIDYWEKLPVSAARYILLEKGNLAIEKLAKIGMFTLAEELIKIAYDKDLMDQGASELARMLKIDNARLKRLKKMDGGVKELRWLQEEKKINSQWPDELITDFSAAEIKYISDIDFLEPPYHIIKIWNYLKKQSVMSGDKMRQTISTWKDYTNMAKKAKWNVSVQQIGWPKDLKEAHGKVILALQGKEMSKQAKKLEKEWPKVNEILPSIKKFEYEADGFCIVTPNDIMDMVREGTALRHCLHTADYYFDRIQKNEAYPFFLRKSKSPDMSWYTLEVEPSGNIRQKRTTGDNQNKDLEEAVKFLKKWQKVFKSRLTKEEIELGILADQARIKEYKELRETGNKIWRGKLAGQLLADVLEKDFMEAI